MKASYFVLSLLALSVTSESTTCVDFTSHLMEQKMTPAELEDQMDLWESVCETEIAEFRDNTLSENKDLQITYQTALVVTDFSLIYYLSLIHI